MSTTDRPAAATPPHVEVHRLRKNAVGLMGVIFMAVATAAPITAMTGNVPIALGSGIGTGVPAGYLVATVVLTVFSVGYVAMARHITAAGAFYGYISHGLGQVAGMVAGLLATMAYVVFEASIIGFFAYQAHDTFGSLAHVDVHWLWFAFLGLALNAILTYFDINLTAKVLGVFLVSEIVMLGLTSVVTLFHGGGPDGLMAGSLNPVNAFGTNGVAGGAVGLGLFMCFWSWVGFESTAMYGEESRDPKRIVPRATLVAVVGIGLFYVFVSWMTVAANGADAPAIAAKEFINVFFDPAERLAGTWAVDVFKILILTGSFACAMAFHNCASRYLYAIGREGLVPGTARTLGRTHPRHGSPHIAGFAQTAVSVVLVLAFFLTGMDPYVHMYTLLAVLGTLAILIVQSLCSFAVIGYFHVRKKHPETANVWRTLVAPLAGGVAMLYVVLLLFQNQEAAAGDASKTPLFRLIPWIVLALAALGAGVALYLRSRNPAKFEIIGRVVLEDTAERD
ncbi:amino acid permease [Sphaerisporangium siamense]|uniref:Amino acid transporter n=1 Tax=Sphaerisporangium siamense TaxID=795645 RepID=A0A7W7DA75_9ACTN|nr:APC family permease [Sphaerisporangium siamense]MBB4703112.1 amino acid transporter [Sphaerisporangium siamense]GII89299.1 amino acid permease [Sphaerisporangium siamense]